MKRVQHLTAESARALAVVGVSIQGTVGAASITSILLTVVTVVVTQTRLWYEHNTIVTYNTKVALNSLHIAIVSWQTISFY